MVKRRRERFGAGGRYVADVTMMLNNLNKFTFIMARGCKILKLIDPRTRTRELCGFSKTL